MRARRLGLATAVFVVVAVLAVDPGGLAPFGPAKWAVVSAGVVGLAALAMRRSVAVSRRPVVVLAVLLVWVGAAAAFGVDPLYAWTGTPERHWGFLSWVLVAAAFVTGQVAGASSSDRRAVTWGAAVAAAVSGAWATAEAAGWQPLALLGAGSRPVGPFGSSAYLGAALVLLTPVAAGVAFDRNAGRGARLAGGAGAAMGVAGLVASGARAAWVGALVAAALWLVARVRPSRQELPRLVALAGAATVAVVALAYATNVQERPAALVSSDQGGVRGRVDEWRVASRVIGQNPVLGVGPEGYRIAFASAVDARYERAHGRDPLPDRAHSAILDVAAAAGLPAAALYLTLLGTAGVFWLRALREGGPRGVGVAAGLVGYFVQSMFLFPIPEIDVIAWLLAGAVVAASASRTELVVVPVGKAVAPALAAVSVAALVLGALDVAADRAARATLAQPGKSGGTPPERSARLRPDAIRYRIAAARWYEAVGTAGGLDSALDHLDRALDVAPRDPVIRRERARLLLDRARVSQSVTNVSTARTALQSLAESDPLNAETQLRLGLVHALAGDAGAAERAWLAAERLAPRSAAASTNLAIAYARAGRVEEARAAARRALRRDPGQERAAGILRELDGT